MAERAQRAANRKKRLQIKKSTSSIWQRTRCKYSQHNQIKNGFPFNTRVRCQIDEDVFLICWCFFYFHVFSEVAARWALLATIYMYKETDFCVNVSFNFSPELLRKWYNLQWYWIETCSVLHPKHNSRLISLITVIFLYLVWTLLAAPAVSLTPECNSMGCIWFLQWGWRKSLPFQGSCLKISLEWVALLPYAPEEDCFSQHKQYSETAGGEIGEVWTEIQNKLWEVEVSY